MNDTLDPIAGLRDVHEPPPPEITYPLAILLSLAILSYLLLRLLVRGFRRRHAHTRAARQALRDASRLPPTESLHACARILRELMHRERGDAVNDLSGERWLEALDQRFSTQWFSAGRGRVFGDTLYRADCARGFDTSADCRALVRLLGSRPT